MHLFLTFQTQASFLHGVSWCRGPDLNPRPMEISPANSPFFCFSAACMLLRELERTWLIMSWILLSFLLDPPYNTCGHVQPYIRKLPRSISTCWMLNAVTFSSQFLQIFLSVSSKMFRKFVGHSLYRHVSC